MNPETIFPWLRYWSLRGEKPTLACDYLVPPETKPDWFSAGQQADLKTLRELSEVRCLVLLGDPGTGKSNEIAMEAVRLSTPSREGLVVKRLDLKRRNESLIEKEAFESAEFIGWTEGRHALALFFDSMDECWRRVPELGPVIIAGIQPHLRKQLPPLYLRLGCRAAEWREEIEYDLRDAFGEEKKGERVQIWELAPLTEQDVRIAATASGLDAAKFLGEVKEREVNVFSAHPITLRMLLATAREGGPLGRDRAEIYQKGCALLCRDHHQDEKGRPRLTSTLQERLACASYLAAVCVLSNLYLILGSTERRPDEGAGAIAGQDVLGQKTLLPDANITITREILAETLQTGLFDAQSGDLFSWRHQSYAEYLAAHYLQLRGIPPTEIIQLLCDTSSGRPRLWPQVEETACWLAPLIPEVFNLLVDDNAEVFIRCDPVRLGLEQRARIVTCYLDQVRGHQAQADGREVSRLSRLAHPGLLNQLAPFVADRTHDVFLRDLALDIVGACELRELVDQLVVMMFTPGEAGRLRHSAANTLRQWADDEIRTKIRAHLKPELLDDDDVRGSVLGILWPGTLTDDELVPFLIRPAKDNYIGAYQVFLGQHFPLGLARANLVPLIRWARSIGEYADDHDHRSFEGAGGAVLLAAFRSIEKPEVRGEFMAAVKEYADRHCALFKRESRNLAEEQSWRRIFWRELVAGELPVRTTIIAASLRETGLVSEEDFDWVIDEATTAKPKERQRWLELAFWIFRPTEHLDQIARLEPFAAADPALADRLQQYTTSQLIDDTGEQNWQKEQYYRDEKNKAASAQRMPFSQWVDENLNGYETSKKPNFIWALVSRLRFPLRDFDEPGGHNMSEVGWKNLTSGQRERILVLAPSFIPTVTVELDEVYEKGQIYWNYVAGVSFLLELLKAGSTWPSAQSDPFWNSWTPAIIQYQKHVYHMDDEAWQPLLQLAFERAKPAFITATARWLSDRGDLSFPMKRFELLPIGSDPQLENSFLDHALKNAWKDSSEFDFLGFLLRHKSARTEEILRSWLPTESAPPHEKGALADALLMCGRPTLYARATIDRILQDPAWGRNVFFHLASMGGVLSNWVDAVDAERLARVWEFLDHDFPGDPYENGDGTVTAIHEIAIFRNHLINYIQKRGTLEAIEAFRGLLRRHPNYNWLGQVLAQTREIVRRDSWKPSTVSAAITYLARSGTPPLCNATDLADAVKASLGRYQALLKGPNPPTELWNESAGPVKIWAPKDEENVSDCLARHIERDLNSHQVHVARESELRQGTPSAKGDEPDLVVTAPSASGDGQKLTVVVEVKCSWNSETVTGLEQQLLRRYLRGLQAGVYVVAHFNCTSWSDTDYRKRQMLGGKSLEEVSCVLETERRRLAATTQNRFDVVILDASV